MNRYAVPTIKSAAEHLGKMIQQEGLKNMMNIDALYDYLKLLVPNDYHVEMGSDFITVNKFCNGVYDLDVYYLKGEYIVLSAMNYDLNKYVKGIFGKPLSKETFTTYNEYYFDIPEGLQ